MGLGQLTRFFHSRVMGVGMAFAVTVCAFAYYYCGYSVPVGGNRGLVLPSANLWLGAPWSFYASMICFGACVGAMLMLNKHYNVLRSMTWIYIALYGLMELSVPDLMTQLYTGSVLGAVIPAATLAVFSCFREPMRTRRVFIVYFMLSALTATQYCYAVYLPVMMILFAQMRVFTGRTVAAALLGIITPWWLLVGFGVVDLSAFALPRTVSLFSGVGDARMLVASAGLTAVAALACHILNVFKTIAYNARARAYNGAFAVLLLFTLVAMVVDYGNLICYVPLLNFCGAIEVSHYFSTHRSERSFIALLCLFMCYIAIFICQILI